MYLCYWKCETVYLKVYCGCAASVDVDRIAREMDFQALQANIMNITFCNIDSEVLCVCVCVCVTTGVSMVTSHSELRVILLHILR